MFQVTQIQSEKFTSNVYVLSSTLNDAVYLIDCGGFIPVLDYLEPNKQVLGIFLTHYHFDHIYFLAQWIEMFPNVIVFGSEVTLSGINDAKINLSFYHEDSVGVELIKFQYLNDGDIIKLFDGVYLNYFLTEGHCDGCSTYIVGNYVFTGDALIPNIPTVTKLKTGSRQLAKNSIQRIKNLVSEDSFICPGHLDMIVAKFVDWNLY